MYRCPRRARVAWIDRMVENSWTSYVEYVGYVSLYQRRIYYGRNVILF